MSIMDQISSMDPKGRFLMENRPEGKDGPRIKEGTLPKASQGRDSKSNDVHPIILGKSWVVVEFDKAIVKVMRRLREKVSDESQAKGDNMRSPSMSSDATSADDSTNEQTPNFTSSHEQKVLSCIDESDCFDSLPGSIQESSGNDDKASDLNGPAFAALELKTPSPLGSSQQISLDIGPLRGSACPETTQPEGQETKLPARPDASVPLPEKSGVSNLERCWSLSTQDEGEGVDEKICNQKMRSRGLVVTDTLVSANAKEDIIPSGPCHQQAIDQINSRAGASDARRSGAVPAAQNDSNLDQDVETFLRDFSVDHDDEGGETLHELCLPEWIEQSKPGTNYLPAQISEYIRSALVIALKLTECFIEAEKKELIGHENPIPLASITVNNVLIRAKEVPISGTVIEYVWTMSNLFEDPDAEQVTARLHAMGLLMYELFTTEAPQLEEDLPDCQVSSSSVYVDPDTGRRPHPKKRQTTNSASEDRVLLRLEAKGLPSSLCFLVKNLIECSDRGFCRDGVYTSFAELRLDLLLMVDEPSRFLDDVRTNPLPSLEVRDRLYGREDESARLVQAYQRHRVGRCSSVIITGGAGVGKSRLARQVIEKLTGGISPGSACERPRQPGASSLAAIVPGLVALMPSSVRSESPSGCVDSALSIQFLFNELLGAISSCLPPLSIFLDDLQWADRASLALVENLMRGFGGSGSVFFTICYRDDVSDNASFNAWLSSVSGLPLETIRLGNMSPDSVNDLVADTLRLSPRITRSLALVLHHKTQGNTLYLRQLLDFLETPKYIYFQMHPPRWAWDLDKIRNVKISGDVVALLITEMQMLDPDLQLGLEIASCMVTKRGFMSDDDGDLFSFSHDKIQQAAYELMPERKRSENHLRLGLALCQYTLSNCAGNDDLFFTAVNQLNQGGPSIVNDHQQKGLIAGLNLQAGRCAITLSDYSAAFQLFQHGISFLSSHNHDHWAHQYELSIDLFNAATEAACVLNMSEVVKSLSDQLVSHSKCFEDTLTCLYTSAKSSRHANNHRESMELTFKVLSQLGEERPCPMGDSKLTKNMQDIRVVLDNKTDSSILEMQASDTISKKIDTLLKLYENLAHVLHFLMPSLICSVSLRMAELTLKNGLSSVSPVGFAYYGQMLVVTGNLAGGCRLGLHIADESHISGFPGEKKVLECAQECNNVEVVTLVIRIHRLVRAFLFHQPVDMALNIGVSELMTGMRHSRRPLNVIGIFFEGISSFLLARETNEASKWLERGEAVLAELKSWSDQSSWNWQNKLMLLEAEKMHTLGNFERASSHYESAIRSARQHRFLQEEAISCELAGIFFDRRGGHKKTTQLLLHSVRCYDEWGATAVATCVQSFVATKYGSDFSHVGQSSNSLDCVLNSTNDASKKRQMR
ncbi:hypothetical protein ACHAWF_015589 [Thalassiosira exigua]